MSFNISQDVSLSDVCDFQEGYVNPSQKKSEYFGGTIKWLRATDLNNGFVYDTGRTLSEAGFKSAGKSALLFEPNSIVISKSGTIGRLGIIKDYMCGNRATINIKPKSKIINYMYLFYFLLWKQNMIADMAVGSVQKNLYTSILGSVKLKLPTQEEQRAISHILSMLDEKSEVNNKINKTLENMAQEIFKRWFVDFEFPNGDGEPYKSSGGEMVESELGLIPRGWSMEKLADFVNVRYGKDHKKLEDGDIPVFGSGGIMRYVNKSLYSSESVLIPRKGTLNNVIYLNEPFWSVDTMFYTEMKNPKTAKFIYFFMKDKDLMSMNSGSAVPSMTTDILNKLKIVRPPVTVIESFDYLIKAAFHLIKNNEIETDRLSKIRDLLLPRLMSGEIRVPMEES